MATRLRQAAAGLAALLALWVGWGLYVTRTTERVPYAVLDSFDGVEVRRYQETMVVETSAPSEMSAFRRLFRYIAGANDAREEVAMTVPVETEADSTTRPGPVERATGTPETVAMTAPVRTGAEATAHPEGKTTMAFYLPAEFDVQTAPVPTDPRVSLRTEPARTVAAQRFSWYASDGRVERHTDDLLDALAVRGLEPAGDPVLLQYNDPWTPPFLRRNEVAVEVSEAEIPVV
ncbi:SOUL family heme-binding protein [Halobacteriales archaeon Cl-PHB]